MSHLLKEYKIDGTEHRIVINYSTEYFSCFKSAMPGLVKAGLAGEEAFVGVLRQTILTANLWN
jgi:hypothetical protein